MTILLILVFSIIVIFEAPALIRQGYWRELVVFGSFLSLGFILSLLLTLGVKLPQFGIIITQLVEAIFK
jgi:regulator of protease activity HflC (stomatin/prohibitin superfamily)